MTESVNGKPLKVVLQRTITEVMFVCPVCYGKTIVAVEKPQDIPCVHYDGENPCNYVMEEKYAFPQD
jgi:hypothetical protein